MSDDISSMFVDVHGSCSSPNGLYCSEVLPILQNAVISHSSPLTHWGTHIPYNVKKYETTPPPNKKHSDVKTQFDSLCMLLNLKTMKPK